ncbi:enoyl-CoA hydratase-related protein [Glacieibacterium megasporae]|uniref:enoyl-CoA hydratase-related protein n=1 Tax=Glacieibacterium megasporae TaxID=2835787 RepID=UPI0021057383|nr:enoyl-CoA hydratase-related protein [Polymorphobacter megasporae]
MDSHAHLALSQALDALAADEVVRVVVLTGAGERAFSAGRDLKELAGGGEDADTVAARWRQITRLTDRFDYPKPLIARVQGLALGGGFELALACDIIVAASGASFAMPEPKRGLIPSAGGVHRLPRQMPLKIAMGCLLTGRGIDAGRAFDLGLVNEVVPADRLDAAVAEWAAEIIACAPLAIRAIRQAAAGGLGMPLHTAMAARYEAEDIRRSSRDAIEGPLAFAEKRPPRWTGQ